MAFMARKKTQEKTVFWSKKNPEVDSLFLQKIKDKFTFKDKQNGAYKLGEILGHRILSPYKPKTY
jgi:hypothetical protein